MFLDNELIDHLQTNNRIDVDSLVIVEWNQNDFLNLDNYGNYRFRPDSASAIYRNLMPLYDSQDLANLYTGALESNYISEYKTQDLEEPLTFITKETSRELYYSLKDCIKPFRPRSGINKMLFFGESNLNNEQFIDSIRSGGRPRYYFSSRFDKFKYWNSYRKEDSLEYGISSKVPTYFTTDDPSYKINDCIPFVTYKNEIATNRIVVKMQTNLADTNAVGMSGTQLVPDNIRKQNVIISDPLKDINRSSIPKRWKIQYLDNDNNWNDAISFNETLTRKDGSRIVPWDGHVEIYYGVKIPDKFKTSFHLYQYLDNFDQLPDTSMYNSNIAVKNGDAYIVGSSTTSAGQLYVWSTEDEDWLIYDVSYGFSLLEEDDTKRIGLIKKIVDPDYFTNQGQTIYRDFIFIKGLRVVVETMYAPNKTFDLIEISPRLKADITDYTLSYDINKNIAATDYGLPVGGLVASTGAISLSNHDGVFTELNTFDSLTKKGSLVANNLKPQVKFDFYECILNVNGYDKFIPLKTFYSENSMVATSGMEDVSLNLRDAYFLFESNNATPIFLQNCTLTMAVALLLDNIGFSNYIFKNISSANDPTIPFFFVEPDISVAEVLQRLAQATQTAMFFDEYNNFVVMPKEYLMPDVSIRDIDSSIVDRLTNLYGQKTNEIVPNIQAISGFETKVINSGQINYTTRYIQREVSRLEQAQLDLSERTYGYKSSILWELGDQKELRTINQPTSNVGYALGAVPLNTSLTNLAPYVENHQIKNNLIDIGESAIWLPRFQGYLFANGEIIRYDAQQYHVDSPSASATNGLVWITNNNEYQKYFSELVFNGKIFPTGVIRIYTEPYYENASGSNFEDLEENVRYKNGPVKMHGRGQFGTPIESHYQGLSSNWENKDYIKSFRMDSENLFSLVPAELISYQDLTNVVSASAFPLGNDTSSKNKVTISNKIANFMKQSVRSEYNYSTSDQKAVGTIQSSALIIGGPYPVPSLSGTSLSSSSDRDLLSYIYKDLGNNFAHVGTRMRIIGKQKDDNNQTALNSSTYFTGLSTSIGDSNSDLTELSGGSGGIGYMIDENTNSGYYFEIAALSSDILSYFDGSEYNSGSVSSASASGASTIQAQKVIENVIFYKVENKPYSTQKAGKTNIAVPKKLWGSLARIIVDEGKFVGSDRLISQEMPVYDLAIEAEILNNKINFFLYLNNNLIGSVTDNDPLPMPSTGLKTCLFTRASSKCMFDNIYALKNKAGNTQSLTAKTGNGSALSELTSDLSISESLRKYSLPAVVQATYLSSIGTESSPSIDYYFEEFGTILRECAYFNIKYDQAYPAIVAKIVPPFSSEKSYNISGFLPGSYGAEFLIFNSTDKAIDLSENSTNRLMIQGITFTQNISNVLTVDDYFKELSNFSDPVISSGNLIVSPERSDKIYDNIKNSRSIYGNKSFSIDSIYIQNEDSAKDVMKWILNKTIKPRKVFELDTFGTQHIQLGDLVKIDYDLPEGVKLVDSNKKFVVISATYGRSSSDVKSQLRLMEV
jgi:hypothetical protein